MVSPSVLHSRAGDARTAKACIAAKFSGADFQIAALDEKTLEAAKTADGSSPFPGAPFRLVLGNGMVLSEPNAVMRYLADGKLASGASEIQVDKWLSWEETELLPAVLTGDAGRVTKAMDHLAQSLTFTSQSICGGKQPTLADIAVFATLLCDPQRLHASIVAWMKWLESSFEPFAVGVQMALMGEERRAFEDLALTDGAEFALRDHLRKTKIAKVPIPGKRNILVTSALPYVNNVPHLGNIVGCVLSADCYARFARARGYNVAFMCGTDEYGTATETKAMEEGITPREICDKYHVIHKSIYDWFDISFDKFGRTSTPVQTEIAQDIFLKLLKRGKLVEQSMDQLYSDALQKFLADRFVEGTCPKCKYEDARGDQCDQCGSLLNPTELIRPRCKFSGTTPRMVKTDHMFLDLPNLKDELEAYINSTAEAGGWSSNSVQVTNAWIRDGLKPRCITRDLKWGTPVPMEKFKEKVFYVWFDAPIGYISITAGYTPEWKKWWYNPKEVEMVQFMGKDNIPFHTVIFPSTQLGTGEDWTMMKTISVCEYLNYEDGKFSKSRGVGVFGNDAQDTGIPSEVWRYYLLSNRPEQSDTCFTWSDLQAKNNNELLANLGNFINRCLSFISSRFEGQVPAATAAGADVAEALGAQASDLVEKYIAAMEKVRALEEKWAEALGAHASDLVEKYIAAMEKVRIKDGIKVAMELSAAGNKFLQDNKPWELLKTDKDRCATVLAAGAGLVRLLAALLQPYMPAVSDKILTMMNLKPSALDLGPKSAEEARQVHKLVDGGHKLGKIATLFRNITDDEVVELKARYSGDQAAVQAAKKAAEAAKAAKSAAAKAAGGGGKGGAGGKGGGDGGGKGKGGGEAAGGKGEEGGKKEKKEKGAKPLPTKKDDGPVDVSRLDIRVGVIKKVQKHPDADSLYVEQIDLGEGEDRTVVSGLVKFIPEDKMLGARVVCLCNLKPAAMRGIKSHAMVLCASNADHTAVELLQPPEGVPIGERITVEGYPGEPDAQLNPKKKVFEAVAPDLATGADLVAAYKGVPFMTSKGPCRSASIAGEVK